MAEAERDVDAVGHEVAGLLPRDEVDVEPGMTLQEPGQARGQHLAGEEGVDVDPEAPAHGDAAPEASAAAASSAASSGATSAWNRAPSSVSRSDRVVLSKRRMPIRALEARHGAADAGVGQAERLGGPHEAAALHHGVEHADAGQETRVVGHGAFLIRASGIIGQRRAVVTYELPRWSPRQPSSGRARCMP